MAASYAADYNKCHPKPYGSVPALLIQHTPYFKRLGENFLNKVIEFRLGTQAVNYQRQMLPWCCFFCNVMRKTSQLKYKQIKVAEILSIFCLWPSPPKYSI